MNNKIDTDRLMHSGYRKEGDSYFKNTHIYLNNEEYVIECYDGKNKCLRDNGILIRNFKGKIEEGYLKKMIIAGAQMAQIKIAIEGDIIVMPDIEYDVIFDVSTFLEFLLKMEDNLEYYLNKNN